jgi:hypothetical protein
MFTNRLDDPDLAKAHVDNTFPGLENGRVARLLAPLPLMATQAPPSLLGAHGWPLKPPFAARSRPVAPEAI